MKMSDKKTKVECRLVIRSDNEANAKVIDDLAIPDPEAATGEQIIREAIEKDSEDEGKPKNSG